MLNRINFKKINERGITHHLALVMVFIGLFGIVGAYFLERSHAATVPLYRMCDNGGYGSCIADNGNYTFAGNNIIMRSVGNLGKADDFHLYWKGAVSSSKVWPFLGGLGLNAKYNGDWVYWIEYAPSGADSGWCADVPNDSGGYVVLEKCGSSTYWVEDSADYWISVQATNFVDDQQVYVLWSNGQSSGSLTHIKDYQKGNGWEMFLLNKIN
jgi:hypothetical protein